MNTDKSTPFWDANLPDEARISWLLEHLTVDEKLRLIAGGCGAGVERQGIPGVGVGGEAAHGVQARNDWGPEETRIPPDVTTSFVQPIGMSATWDPELLRRAGEVTGTEARALAGVRGGHGLCRWAPTVDIERDPRWGRTEEAYGEDPFLTGEMAGAYVRGMRGDDPRYIRVAATLKHFYANNTEYGRTWKNASIDPRNKRELYLEPFRRVIENGGAEAVMTAYNRINGVPGIVNPDVQRILKDEYGVTHVVGDGGEIVVRFTVTNAGGAASDEVAQVYAAFPKARVKRPVRQLVGFVRLKDIAPGETRAVEIRVPVDELRYYDVISRKMIVQAGRHAIMAGRSSGNLPLRCEIDVPGEMPGLRDMRERTSADHYDEYENVLLTEGQFGYPAAALADEAREGVLIYRDADEASLCGRLTLHMMSARGCEIEVRIGGELAGTWAGDTRDYNSGRPFFVMDERMRADEARRIAMQTPQFADVEIPLSAKASEGAAALELRMRGDVRLCRLRCAEK